MLEHPFAAGRVEDLDGTPVYSLVNGPDRALALTAKRIFDVGSAAVGLVLLSPFLLFVAWLIKRQDGGPVLFRQTRIGLHGRPFEIYKFRSMEVGAEDRVDELAADNEISGQAFKVTHDPRITPLGFRLRRWSIDELPQLWNVLRGDMSLVGPRPPLPERGQGLRPMASPAAVDEARHHRSVAGPQPPCA